jgi:serine/threonine-protein kinase
MPVATHIRPGAEFAGYTIEALIGRGGMSVVYRAEHRRLKRKVALKLLAPELAENQGFRERFLRESELAAALDHPNIVPVYDAGEVEGRLYIAMRLVEGTDLGVILRREGRLEPRRALTLAGEVADALDVAHARGLVHRDVKPSNVLVAMQAGKEHCYLADFGLTKSMSEPRLPVDAGRMVGTIDYVAPEQIRKDTVDGRADVYSLACLLFECLTGEPPFGRPSEMAVIYAHLEEDPPRASERRSELPAGLDEVFEKAMAKEPAARYESAGAFVAAAREAFNSGRGETVDQPGRHRMRRLLVVVTAAAVPLAVGLGILASGDGGGSIARAAVVRIDPVDAQVSAPVEISGTPTAVIVCAGSVWVTSRDGAVSEIDPKSASFARIAVRGLPSDVADVGNLAAVVTSPPNDGVTMIDAEFGGISDVVSLPGRPVSAATATAYGPVVWIANPNAREIERLEPPYTHLMRATGVASRVREMAIAAGEGAVWVTGGRRLWRVNATTGRLVATVRLGFTPADVATGAGAVWLTDDSRRAIVRVDPVSDRIVARIRVGRDPVAVAVGSGAVWVANRGDGTISRIDPRRDVVERTITVGSRPVDVAVGLKAVWVVRQPG